MWHNGITTFKSTKPILRPSGQPVELHCDCTHRLRDAPELLPPSLLEGVARLVLLRQPLLQRLHELVPLQLGARPQRVRAHLQVVVHGGAEDGAQWHVLLLTRVAIQ